MSSLLLYLEHLCTPGSHKLIVPARLHRLSPSTLECVRRFRRRVERRPLEKCVVCGFRGDRARVCVSVWHVCLCVCSFVSLRWHALD